MNTPTKEQIDLAVTAIRAALDALDVPEKRTVKVWATVFDNGSCQFFLEKPVYDFPRGIEGDHIARIEREITYTVGEGLDR